MPKKSVPTLNEWFRLWVDGEDGRAPLKTLRPRSQSNYRSQFRCHIQPLLGDRRLDTLTRADARMVVRETKSKSAVRPGIREPGKVNAQRTYALLHVLMNDAVEEEVIDGHSVYLKDMGKDASAKRPEFTWPQFDRVRANLRGPYGDAADIILGAALRKGEALGLEWGDWDPRTGRLWVARQSDGGDSWPTKNSNPDYVHVLEVGALALERMRPPWASPTTPILNVPSTRWGRRMTRAKLGTAWSEARRFAGLPDFHLHDVRHIALTHYARSGATLAEVQQFGRHKNVGSALRYQHAADDERQRELKANADQRARALRGEAKP